MTEILKAADFASDQDIRWCPGCGDFAILKQVQHVMPDLGIPREQIVFISGIGCSSRFPYYMNTYGMHSIHGRAPAFATGLKTTRPDLSVWVITGDGDALSIGGNHLIHTLRRNVDLNILLFNNQIYGLTKGQYSPSSELHKVTKSSPQGSPDYPFNPLALALGANAGFIARSMDREAKHLQEMIRRANAHKGSALLEIYQNCHIFNDGAFDEFTDRASRKERSIFVSHGQPLVFGENDSKGIKLDGNKPIIVEKDEDFSLDELWIHDEKDLWKAQTLVRFFDDFAAEQELPRVFGVLYANERPTYETIVNQQVSNKKLNPEVLLSGKDTWSIKAN